MMARTRKIQEYAALKNASITDVLAAYNCAVLSKELGLDYRTTMKLWDDYGLERKRYGRAPRSKLRKLAPLVVGTDMTLGEYAESLGIKRRTYKYDWLRDELRAQGKLDYSQVSPSRLKLWGYRSSDESCKTNGKAA